MTKITMIIILIGCGIGTKALIKYQISPRTNKMIMKYRSVVNI